MLLRGTTVTFEGDTAVSSVIDMHSISHVGAGGGLRLMEMCHTLLAHTAVVVSICQSCNDVCWAQLGRQLT
jgi:hypothetical protein